MPYSSFRNIVAYVAGGYVGYGKGSHLGVFLCRHAECKCLMRTALIVHAGSEVDLSQMGSHTNPVTAGAVLAPEIELDNSPIPSRVTASA